MMFAAVCIGPYASLASSLVRRRPSSFCWFRWIFAPYVALALVYAWGVIPVNGCRPDIYLRLLAHLGLLPEVGL